MVTRSKLTRRLLAGLAVLALFTASCGSNEDSSSSSSDGASATPAGEGEFTKLDLSKVDITVGSKDFTENQVIAEMFAQAIEAGGGKVDRKINLGGTEVNRQALESGSIGAYPEYNGTGWTVHLGHDDPSSDPKELYDVTAKEDLEKNKIHWLGRSEFNDTYGFATNKALSEKNGGPFTLQQMADYVKANPDATVCMETEFPDRPDGLVLFKKATGFDIPKKQQKILDTGIIYNETAQGNCEFGEVFTTDGRIVDLKLDVVDDGGAFIIYNVSMTLDDEAYQQAPEDLTTISEKILNDLDNDKMAELNGKVDTDGQSLDQVAKDYLTSKGLI